MKNEKNGAINELNFGFYMWFKFEKFFSWNFRYSKFNLDKLDYDLCRYKDP